MVDVYVVHGVECVGLGVRVLCVCYVCCVCDGCMCMFCVVWSVWAWVCVCAVCVRVPGRYACIFCVFGECVWCVCSG